MRISEVSNVGRIKAARKFIDWALAELGIKGSPPVKFTNDIDKVRERHTFGTTEPNGNIWVYVGNRNTADVLRTLCHELVHYRQFQRGTASLNMSSKERLQIEDEANALAGRLLRKYGKENVEIYEGKSGSIVADVAAALPATYAIPKLKNNDAYLQYRFGVAMAGAKGAAKRKQDGVPEFHRETLWGENVIVSSTDPNIETYIDDALEQLGLRGKKLISTKTSQEADGVGSTSPLKPFKGYPR